MQDVICTLVMWLNTCVRFRQAECQLFSVQLQKCFVDNETSPDFLSLKDWMFKSHFRASLNCEFVLFHIYVCSSSDCSLEWMIPALFFVFFAAECLATTFRDGTAATERLAGSQIIWGRGKPFAWCTLNLRWKRDCRWKSSLFSHRPRYTGCTQTTTVLLIIAFFNHIYLFLHPESCLPRCRTCDAAVRVLRKRSQQQVGEGRHGGAFPPEHRHKWLPAVRGGVLFSTSTNLQKSTQTKTNTPECDVTIRLEPQMLWKDNRSSISPHCSPWGSVFFSLLFGEMIIWSFTSD